MPAASCHARIGRAAGAASALPARRSRSTSFVADPHADPLRILHAEGDPAHRLRAGHDAGTLLVHLSDEDGGGWTVPAVDRASRRCVVAQARRQLDAAREAYERPHGTDA